MATDTMELLVRGLNNIFFAGIFLTCFGCKEALVEPSKFYDAGKTDIVTKGGITRVNTTPVTGVVFSLNEKNDTVFVISYLNGKENGPSRYYHPNGKLKAVRYARNGWKEGAHMGWYEDGQKQFEYHFKNDMFEGNQKEWLPSGSLYSDLNYEEGMESGSQRVWYPNGKIKTNYVIKNNRRYGLLGTKNCVNTTDSVFTKL
jgi:antitoxin component YwqK of YwqJK toxin-antitoxin module